MARTLFLFLFFIALDQVAAAQGDPRYHVDNDENRNALPYIACPVRFNFTGFHSRADAPARGVVLDSLGNRLGEFEMPNSQYGFILTDRCDWAPMPALRMEVYQGDSLRQVVPREFNTRN